jgi:release factor glutamine methyltransferase
VRPSHVVRRAADYLERHDVDAPLATAEVLLAHVLGTDRTGVYTRDEPLRADEARAYGRSLCRRCSGVPTQHVTGEASFRHLIVEVRPGVFVPRPETEVVVDVALAAIADRAAPAVVDVGTGTGVIALAIAQERPDARVWATDRSEAAVELARVNAGRLGLTVDVRRGDLLGALTRAATGPLDLVVSNPPYVDAGDLADLPREARADPVEALVGGPRVYSELFDRAAERLAPGGAVVVEIEESQGPAVATTAHRAGAATVAVTQDLTGRDRVVAARWP